MSNYARRMAHLSARIFGEVARPVPVKSLKIVKLMERQPYYKRSDIVQWYPNHPQMHLIFQKLRDLGLFRDEHMDFKDEMKRLRGLRGKVKEVPQHALERRERITAMVKEQDAKWKDYPKFFVREFNIPDAKGKKAVKGGKKKGKAKES